MNADRPMRSTKLSWASTIPADWEVGKLSEHAIVISGFPFPSEGFGSEGIPLVRIRDVLSGVSETYYSGASEDEAPVYDGDVLIGMDGDFHVGKWRGGRAALNQRVSCVRTRDTLTLSYLFYCLPFPLKIINDLTYYTTVKHLSAKQISDIALPLPRLEEQRAIADFLDRETARIDALIEKKRRLMELLEEKRIAVITHAVTKGLDPSAPMKDSGQPHIGTVPAHWDIVPLRRILDCGSGDFLSNRAFELELEPDCKVPVVGGNGVMGYTSDHNSPGGTLVIGRVGAHCGNIHLVSEPCWVTDNALRVSWRKTVHPPFMKRLLDALGLNRIANRNAQPLITGSMIKSQIVAIPPQLEQEKLTSYLDVEEHKVTRVRDVESRAIELLQEYRSSLITNAVTGKIDVREAAQKEAAQ